MKKEVEVTMTPLEILDNRERECKDHLALLDEMERADRRDEKIASIVIICYLVFVGAIGLICSLGIMSFW